MKRYVLPLTMWFVILLLAPGARAEIGIGFGDIFEQTEAASATVHDGLSSFHRMMAGIERRNMDAASPAQGAAVEQLDVAARMFERALDRSDTHEIQPKPQSAEERANVEFFNRRASDFGVQRPITQRELLRVTIRLVRNLGQQFKSLSLLQLQKDVKMRVDISTRVADTLLFLLSVTTVLTSG